MGRTRSHVTTAFLTGCSPRNTIHTGLHTDIYGDVEATEFDDVAWTDEETLRLLEAVQLHRDAWSKVADHVNNACHRGEAVRSHDDCIMAFLKLPIEDPFLEAESVFARADDEQLPFHNTKNPLLATLSFLGRVVGASVAAAGAQGALHHMTADVAPNFEQPTATDQVPSADGEQVTNTSTEEAAPATAVTSDDPVSSERLQKAVYGVFDAAAEKARVRILRECPATKLPLQPTLNLIPYSAFLNPPLRLHGFGLSPRSLARHVLWATVLFFWRSLWPGQRNAE